MKMRLQTLNKNKTVLDSCFNDKISALETKVAFLDGKKNQTSLTSRTSSISILKTKHTHYVLD